MAAEDRVREKYSWEKVTDRYELLYQALMEGRSVSDIADLLEKAIPLEPVPSPRPTVEPDIIEETINRG
jgi:uncharacterized protein YutE (UPF0331/DUF86 family)